MLPANLDFPMIFPPHFTGHWRMNVESDYKIDGASKKECFRTYFDMVDSMYAG